MDVYLPPPPNLVWSDLNISSIADVAKKNFKVRILKKKEVVPLIYIISLKI